MRKALTAVSEQVKSRDVVEIILSTETVAWFAADSTKVGMS